MKKRQVNYGGVILIVLGGIALLNGTLAPLFGWDFGLWHFWPLLVSILGLSFIATPVLFPRQRGLRALFIPGFPILVTSSLLLLGSLFNVWGIWAYLWPLIIIGLAVGFLVSAVFMHNIWLMIPAIIVGTNGLIFQFCTVTGLWDLWAILWVLEPLSVGIALLVASAGVRPRMVWAGLIVCLISVGLFSLMSLVLSGWVSMIGALLLIVAGLGFIIHGRAPVALKEKSPEEVLDGLKL
ncbi:MAG: hypothetical protein H6657_10850 [Ardenticatenaceae bacterium]|nr:hypothetical protein [Ardenticatenaceae bacterium]